MNNNSSLNTPIIQKHLHVLKGLQTSRGLFLASSKDVATGYNKAWLRDNFYTSLAFEEASDWETVKKLWRSILDIFLKHEDKINWAIQHRPHESWQYIHARYNPETFEEYWEEWGNKQNDAIGAILFKLGGLARSGNKIDLNKKDKQIMQKLVDYLYSLQYWNDPDSGIWEEGEEIHSSSIGAVLAGLYQVKDLDFITVPEGIIQNGQDSLNKLLPRESESKFSDLSLLSLVYPFNVVRRDQAQQIVDNIEYYFTRERGVIRYKNDRYYNKNSDGHSEEAEWTMGLSWLSIIYALWGDISKAKIYLEKAKEGITKDGKIPELYFANDNKSNDNIPLAWAESLFIIALIKSG
jgi:phosphorylase kinase alpha/beta subunit